jgi:glyceraldehyde 3-phosphate dehydrogenase
MDNNQINLGINGCGRIAKCLIRIVDNNSRFNLISINHYNTKLCKKDVIKYINYDSIHGKYQLTNTKFNIHHCKNPCDIAWEKKIDIIIDTTGKFKTMESLQPHIKFPHQKVILSCPSEDIFMYIYGVNHYLLALEKPKIFSGASCTTNASSPILKILDDTWGIESCFLTTIHSTTASNNTVDRLNIGEKRLGFCNQLNIIPSTTGASSAISKVNPKLLDKVVASAYRVPVTNVSMIELTVNLHKETNLTEILKVFRQFSQSDYLNVIEVNDDKLASSSFIGNCHSSIIDSNHCQQLGNKFFKIAVWYDNEWGYTNHLINLIKFVMDNHNH